MLCLFVDVLAVFVILVSIQSDSLSLTIPLFCFCSQPRSEPPRPFSREWTKCKSAWLSKSPKPRIPKPWPCTRQLWTFSTSTWTWSSCHPLIRGITTRNLTLWWGNGADYVESKCCLDIPTALRSKNTHKLPQNLFLVGECNTTTINRLQL